MGLAQHAKGGIRVPGRPRTDPAAATRRAWLRFGALGGLLFLLSPILAPPPRLPGVASAAARPGRLSDQEILVRQALARGYEWSDPVVRRRLAMNLRFALGGADTSEDGLVARALAMGMQNSDLVVRRRLAERVSLEVQAAARAKEPTEAELRAWVRAHPERFTAPARIHLQQIPMASAALARTWLPQLPDRIAEARSRGMPLPLPRDLPGRSQAELARLFGGRFARAVFALAPGSWAGPIRSPYAFHLVRVEARTPAHPIPFAQVRSAARESLLEERAHDALHEQIARWRARAPGGDGR